MVEVSENTYAHKRNESGSSCNRGDRTPNRHRMLPNKNLVLRNKKKPKRLKFQLRAEDMHI